MADITEAEMNEFLKKMAKKEEAMKTTVETMSDDLLNNMILVMQKLWKELNDVRTERDTLKKDNKKKDKTD